MLTIKIKFIHEAAQQPVQATPGSAGWDLYAIADGSVPGSRTLRVPLGFAIELPYGWQAKIKQRSGLFEKKRIITNDSPIDSDYRGEVCVLAMNNGEWPWHFKKGERIAQMLFEPVTVVRFVTTEELTPTLRGEGGWGSTGK